MKNPKKNKRQTVREIIAEISPWDLSGTAHDIYKKLLGTEIAYLDKYNTPGRPKMVYDDIISISWEWESLEYKGIDGRFVLTITRLENDKEYNARIKRLKNKEIKSEYLKQKNIR